MDPRQPQQHPFGRNTSSPYGHGRSPFPPSTNPSPFPPSSHAQNAPPVYQEHQRRPSGPPYYAEQRGYPPQDGAPMPGPGPGHTRNQSSSSIGHSTPVMRERPPPFSPQQPPQQQPLHNSHSYGPPPPRPPPVSVGPPSAFPSGRELPGLPSLGRPPSTGMSISSMLGGPSREPAQSQYPPPIPSGPSNTNSNYAGPTHPSPRVAATSAPEYASYRRPQTPDHQRNYEVHDRRANSAGSPQGISQLTPEGARRWGTPQAHTYSQRPQERAMPPTDDRREQQPPQPIRVSNPNMPPRPSSQPTAFNPPPSRVPEGLRGPAERPMENVFGRREEHNPRAAELQSRPEPSYQQRPPPFSDRERENPVYAYAERERRDRELAMQREHERERDREQRERAAIYERDRIKAEYDHRAQVVAQNQHRPPPETREQPAWMRPDYARPRPGYEQPVEQRPPPPQIPTTYDHHPTTTAPYPASSAFAPTDPRLPPGSQPSSMPPQYGTVPASQYEANLQERQRIALAHQLQQQHEQQQSIYDRLPQRPPFPPHESPGRPPPEEAQQATQQRFLGVQEINRKGRNSPLPQAVQGAQAQIGTPGGEPGIKSEFGRMFSGIGSGVGGAMGAPSPVNTGPQNLPFSNSGQMRREDLENGVAQNSPIENGGHGIARSASRGGSRRRKLKEDDSRGDDEDSTGRQTPAFARGKRLKTGDHNHGPRRHHHHQRRPDDQVSSPSQSNLTPFKSVKGGSAIPSPPGHDIRDHPNLHHHIIPAPTPRNRNPTPVRAPPPNPEPIPKRIIRSNQVIGSVAHLPRYHLGHEYYDPTLKPASSNGQQPSIYGFASTPAPLPRFQGQENCTFTIKVPRVHLSHTSRAEITSRRALWGTDIYTDDSDVVAACIHEGWFRGAWPDDIDVDLLNLEIDGPWPTVSKGNANYDGEMTEPPPGGPMEVPKNRDLHVTILILPLLEKYSACIRFGIGSREWGGKHHGYTGVHDGVSFKIQKIKWVEGVDSYAGRIEGKKRMKLLPRAPDPNEPEELAPTQNGHHEGNSNGEMDGVIKESYERGGPAPLDSELGDIKGLGRNWWKEDRKGKQPKSKRVLAAVEKELQRNTEPLAVQEAEHINGNKDVEGRNGDGTASITAQTPPKPYKDRLADMFKRDDF